MRNLLLASVAFCCLTATAGAAGIQTGQDLVTECKDYASREATVDNNALRAPHACRSFLQGFFISLKAADDARNDARLRGIPYASKEQCVRMPDFLSYKEMAARLATYAQANPAVLKEPAAVLAQKTIERDFPCPTPPATQR
jgi:hypothetical protein